MPEGSREPRSPEHGGRDDIGASRGPRLVVYHADVGTAAADKLAMLASYSAPIEATG